MTTEPQFDDYQFDGRKANAVSAKTGLSWQDFGRMHVERRRQKTVHSRTGVPEWSVNDEQMRNVILTFLERRFFIQAKPGASDEERLTAINNAAERYSLSGKHHVDDRLDAYERAKAEGAPEKRIRELEIEAQIADSQAMFDRKPAELLAAVVYMSYRLNYNSTMVAEQLRIRPPAVRILLYRLNKLAANLQAGRPYKRRTRRGPKRPWTRQELVRLWFLRANGLSWAKCAKALGRNSYLIKIYERYFIEQVPFGSKRKGWTQLKLRKLWLLRHTNRTWAEAGTVFGISAASARAAYLRHIGTV